LSSRKNQILLYNTFVPPLQVSVFLLCFPTPEDTMLIDHIFDLVRGIRHEYT
jgi:hypothetical protein